MLSTPLARRFRKASCRWRRRAAPRQECGPRLTNDNPDVQAGINIVLNATEAPIRQIAENAGVEGSIVVGKILETNRRPSASMRRTQPYVDLIDNGIVDPAKVVRAALQDAASVAGS